MASASRIILNEPIVSVEWLNKNLDAENLLIFDASIPKVTSENDSASIEKQIPKSQFFDIKHKFSDTAAPFPNTLPSEGQFEKEARHLGINKNSAIIIYDDKGVYSSPRVWWLFKTFGYDNVAVLNGGLPEWMANGFEVETKQPNTRDLGDFEAQLKIENVVHFNELNGLSKSANHTIIDARGDKRFNCKVPEPRAGLRSGTIPNSRNLPFVNCLENGNFKSREQLQSLFKAVTDTKNTLVFSCGSGITACVLDLAATIAGYDDTKVYDGSWTEYGSLTSQ